MRTLKPLLCVATLALIALVSGCGRLPTTAITVATGTSGAPLLASTMSAVASAMAPTVVPFTRTPLPTPTSAASPAQVGLRPTPTLPPLRLTPPALKRTPTAPPPTATPSVPYQHFVTCSTETCLAQAVQNAAYSGGTIQLASGTYTGDITISQTLSLTAASGASVTLSGAGTTCSVVTVPVSVTVAIAGVTISGGNNTSCTNGQAGVSGGGINNAGALALTDCTVTDNTVTGSGAGIDNSGVLTVTDSTITHNGPVGGTSVVQYSGGGIENGNNGGPLGGMARLVVNNSTISGNNAGTGLGGGIDNEVGVLTLIDSTLSGNRASKGGGILTYSSDVTVTNSTISENTASAGGEGGGLWNGGNALAITNSTISGNTAPDGAGGGIYVSPLEPMTLSNDLILGNGGGDINGSSTQSGPNLIGIPAGDTLAQLLATNSAGQPLLANNGGSTETISLVAGSPAIGAGSASICEALVGPDGVTTDTDQRGVARDTAARGECDLGAYSTGVGASQLPGSGRSFV